MLRNNREQHLKVLIGIQIVCLGGLYQTVQHSAGPGAMVGVDEHKVLAPVYSWTKELAVQQHSRWS